MTTGDVIALGIIGAVVFVLGWARDKFRIGRFPFFFANRPSMRTRFYLEERKKRKQKKHRNSN
jgi:hypothetical protein